MAKKKSEEIREQIMSVKADPSKRGAVWVSTGSDILDCVVGGGRGLGLESGMLVNIPGPSGGGKTFTACEIIANARWQYGDKCKWVFDDAESGFTFDTKRLYGFEIMPFDPQKRTRSKTVEDCLGNIMGFLRGLRPDEFGVYVVDSWDGLVDETTEKEIEAQLDAHEKGEDYDKGTYGMSKQKFASSRFFPTVAEAAERHNCLIIIMSQLRDNVGAGLYAAKDRISCGRALLYYCHARLWIKTVDEIMSNKRQIGTVMHVEAKKMRGHRPFRSCVVNVHFERGIDNVATNLDFLFDLRSDKTHELLKAADKIEWSTETQEPQVFTRRELIKHIEDNDLERELTGRAIDKWEDLEAAAAQVVAERKPRFAHG